MACVPSSMVTGLALLLVVPSAATSAQVSGPDPYAVPFDVRAADDIHLRGHVFLPKGTPPFATVLEYSPYWNTAYGLSDEGDTARRTGLNRFLHAGFAIALVNIRGTGVSGGCLQWGGPVDWDDVGRVVQHLSAQSWSNGNVGMYGISYPGWTQYMAMAAAPPALKAVLPASGIIDPWSHLTRNGAPTFDGPIIPTYFTALTAAGAGAVNGPFFPGGPDPFVPATSPDHLRCPRYAQDALEGAELMRSGDRNDYWGERDLRPRLSGSKVPVFMTNGLTEDEGHILQFEGLWDLLPGEKRFLLGQWGHGTADGHVEGFEAMTVAWFDHYLRGGPEVVAPGVVEYQDDTGGWHAAHRWPPTSGEGSLRLSGKDLIAPGARVEEALRPFVSEDLHHVPAMGCQRMILVELCPPSKDLVAVVESCGGGVRFFSAPLAEEVLLAGNFEVDLTLTSTMPDGNLAATLYHTAGDGACPDPAVREVSRALTDLRHAVREGGVGDFPVAAPTSVTLRSHPFASLVPAGHRLVLEVAGGSLELHPDARKPLLVVHTGPGVDGVVRVPVVDGALRLANTAGEARR